MAVVYDNSVKAGAAANTVTGTMNVAATANWGFALVVVNGFSISGCTWGGTSMTQLGTTQNFVTGYFAALFQLQNPPTGSSINIVGSGNAFDTTVAAISYGGISSLGTLVTNTGASTSVSTGNVSSATGDLAFCAMTSEDGSTSGAYTSFSGNSPHINGDSLTGYLSLLGDATGAATVNFTATSPIANFCAFGIDLIPTTPGSGPDPTAGAKLVTLIPNPQVGPTALRQTKRWPPPPQVSAPPPPASPFGAALQKLFNGAPNVQIQCLGDSTCAGFPLTNGGWTTQMALDLAQPFNATVKWFNYGSGLAGAEYSSQGTLVSGAGPTTITVLNGGINASKLTDEENDIQSSWLLGLQNLVVQGGAAFGAPDLVILYDGYNDIGSAPPGSITAAQWTANVEAYLSQYLIPIYGPNIPILVCNQHTAYSTMAPYWNGDQNYMANTLTGNPTAGQPPLTPALQPAISTYPSTWVLDTQQAFNGYNSDAVYGGAGEPHPNQFGYSIIGQFIAQNLAPQLLGQWSGPWNAPTPFRPANPYVGPMALRQGGLRVRIPYVSAPPLKTSGSATALLTAHGVLTSVAQPAVTATLRATATLSSTAKPSVTANLSAVGRLTATAQPVATASLSAHGQLAATGYGQVWTPAMPLIIPNPYVGPTALRQRKSGRLPYMASSSIVTSGSAPAFLKATAQLSAVAMPSVTANLSAHGQLTAVAKPIVTASLSAHGQLTATDQATATAHLSAHGQLNATAVPKATASLSAVGRLTSLAQPAVTAQLTAQARLSGTGYGQVWTPAMPIIIANRYVGPMALRHLKTGTPYVASGTLGNFGSAGASLTAVGQLTATTKVPASSGLTAHGQLTASVKTPASASLSAHGQLTATAVPKSAVTLTAHGVLTATPQPKANAALTSHALLTTSAKPAVSASLSAHGVLTANPQPKTAPTLRAQASLTCVARNASTPQAIAQLSAQGILRCYASVYGAPALPGATANAAPAHGIANTVENPGIATT